MNRLNRSALVSPNKLDPKYRSHDDSLLSHHKPPPMYNKVLFILRHDIEFSIKDHSVSFELDLKGSQLKKTITLSKRPMSTIVKPTTEESTPTHFKLVSTILIW